MPTLTNESDRKMSDNEALLDWVDQVSRMCQPKDIHWCDGSTAEYQRMLDIMVEGGTALWLDSARRPNSVLVRSDPSDVARVEDRTFICSESQKDAGPNNNWMAPDIMRARMTDLYSGCMRGRTMYVIPYSMGPLGSPIANIGVEITDSPYVTANMHTMTRVGLPVLDVLGPEGDFVRALHSVGAPLEPGQKDEPWPCVPDISKKFITHFPETREIWSFGSGYGGNALLGKKCHALRIASVQARDEGWLAEHMLILKVTNPEGKSKYMAGAFPSACGKTNLAMLEPTVPGWKVETVGDDIAWMKFGADGRLYAINPEAGFFGVAPGTSMQSNPNAMRTISRNTIFTNCLLTPEGDIWWMGMDGPPPDKGVDWKGRPWTPDSGEPGAHPNARFTVPAAQCPVIAPEWEEPGGVPIDAILFGGRRSTMVPLVTEAFDWQHGTFLGAIMGSEMTAAAFGNIGKLRRDPMAMMPFCGYNMGDYFAHWLRIGQRGGGNMPRVFNVDWFRKDPEGRFIWPGFGENSRVLKWIFERCDGADTAVRTPIGFLPSPGSLDVDGLSLAPDALAQLLDPGVDSWLEELESIEEYFKTFGDTLPQGLRDELAALGARLEAAKAAT